MGNQTITENFSELSSSVRKYIQAHIDLLKVRLLEKLVKIGTYFFSLVTLILILAFILISLTFAFSFWYGQVYGNLVGGFLISAGFYLLMAILVIIFRKKLFTNNIIRNLSQILFSDDENENNEEPE
jgi:hypothetical protein